ncbi:MAG: DUF1566 domain-containing protein, partial [Saprospiraceae bacterium]
TSTSLGYATIASGENALAMGSVTKATGANSTSLGFSTNAGSYGSVAIGRYNDSIAVSNGTAWINTDPLLMVGNGTSAGALHNAMIVYKNGNLILKNPTLVSTDPGALPVPASGAGTRMMWLPEKSAFRVGSVEEDQWDAGNIGFNSFASGKNSRATGSVSTAMGFSTLAAGAGSTSFGQYAAAYGQGSFATGGSVAAYGEHSVAMGFITQANGDASFAMGYGTRAKGANSVAFGLSTLAKGFASTAVGMYNDSILTSTQIAATSTTPLFIVGNGDGIATGQRHNAMVVRKDGNVGISTNTPPARLSLVGNQNNPSIPGIASTGVLRIGVNEIEGVDIGKMGSPSYAGWIQSGYNSTSADPLSLQPSGGRVGIGTTSPASSAALDISSTTKGLLPPRMTFVNRNSIASPADGLMIWCNNCGAYGQMQIYNGSFWSNLSGGMSVGEPFIGQYDGGGIIAYILVPGDPGYVAGEVHGLIAAPNDEGTVITWGCSGVSIPGADGTAIGTGNQNTIDIVSGCATAQIAADRCSDLVLGGFNDWFLPSKDELNKLYLNQNMISQFYPGYYWSSSEISSNNAWTQDLSTGTQSSQGKATNFVVRAIRKF